MQEALDQETQNATREASDIEAKETYNNFTNESDHEDNGIITEGDNREEEQNRDNR